MAKIKRSVRKIYSSNVYLQNRKQRTKIGSSHNDWEDITLEVPQSSVLGPL